MKKKQSKLEEAFSGVSSHKISTAVGAAIVLYQTAKPVIPEEYVAIADAAIALAISLGLFTYKG